LSDPDQGLLPGELILVDNIALKAVAYQNAIVDSRHKPCTYVGFFQVTQLAAQFKKDIEVLKSEVGQTEFCWYPNDSLANFEHLDAILSGTFRSILDDPVGRSALDVGAADGDVAFFLESLGFQVKAVDHPPTNYNQMRGIQKLKQRLGSRVEIISADLDSVSELPKGPFDLIFFLGILYHLKNPYRVLDLLSHRARFCFLSSRVARITPEGLEIRKSPIAYLVDSDELNLDATNFWIFSEAGLKRLLRRTGWEVCSYGTVGCDQKSDPSSVQNDERVFCLLRSRHLTDPALTARLLRGWHGLEEGRWRWTERCFSAELSVPKIDFGAALLELRFVYHECARPYEGRLVLSAHIDGFALAEAQYSTAGEHMYRAAVPAHVLRCSTAIVTFELNYAIPADGYDQRERGIIVTNVGFC
jgi:hypothetical protein